jgi:hypothetical protein
MLIVDADADHCDRSMLMLIIDADADHQLLMLIVDR